MSRYDEIVPDYIRALAAENGVPKANWFIPSSEGGYFSGELSEVPDTDQAAAPTNGHEMHGVDFEDPATFVKPAE